MDNYHLDQPVVTEFSHALLGRIRVEFEAGRTAPSSEQEALALDRLARLGLATEVEPEDDEDDTSEEDPE